MKSVLIYSGGLDSTVLLYELKSLGHEIRPLSFFYGQRHSLELMYAEKNCRRLGLAHKVISLREVLGYLPSSQTSQTNSIEVPEGHYAELSMKKTVVPNRNMVMLSAAASYAISEEADNLYYAAHGGDHTIYPDCRPEFVAAMQQTLLLCDWTRVILTVPFLNLTKADIVRRGHSYGVPFDQTWSCYQGGWFMGQKHCGKCGTCVERQEAFALAGVADSTRYRDAEFWKTAKV